MRVDAQERALKMIQHTCPKCKVDRSGYEYSVGDRCCEVCIWTERIEVMKAQCRDMILYGCPVRLK